MDNILILKLFHSLKRIKVTHIHVQPKKGCFFKYQYTVAAFFFTIFLLNVFKNVSEWVFVV